MGIYKRGKVWWIRYTADGQQIRESTNTRSKKAAETLLTKRQAEVFEGRFDIQAVKPSPRFSDYAGEYMETFSKVNKKPRTYKRDKILVEHLKGFFGGRRMSEIRPMLIEQYKRARLEAGKSPGTVNRETSCLKSIFNVAIKNQKAFSNPVRQVPMLHEDNEIVNPVTDKDEALLLKHAAPHLRHLIICGIDTGMRRGEMFDLRWSNVDLVRRTIRVEKTKTHKVRTIPISTRLHDVLVELNRDSQSEYVFVSPKTGEELTKIDTAWRRANERAGLMHKRYRVHDLRGAFITRLLEEGMNPATIMQLSGHASIRMLERYARPGADLRRDAVAALDRRRVRKTVVDFEERRG